MALETDDCDIHDAYLYLHVGGNGDYYVCVTQKGDDGLFTNNRVRVSTSGGRAPTDVLLAVAELHRAMERNGLNEIPRV